MELLKEMLEPNLISYNTVIAAYARVGDVDGVAEVLEGPLWSFFGMGTQAVGSRHVTRSHVGRTVEVRTRYGWL